jgi:uncharacterized protein YkwD
VPDRPLLRRALAAGFLALSLLATVLTGLGTSPAGAVAVSPAGATVTRAATPAQRDSVYRLYRAYFLRAPDTAGHAYWAEEYASGRRPLVAISESFARSGEFVARYGSLTQAQFVALVYRNVLGRAPDKAGEDHWVQRLRGGTSRGAVMVGFSESPEFQRKTGTRPPGPVTPSWVTELVGLVNAERARYGLGPLLLCARLTAAAQGHSDHQARIRTMTHVGADGSDHGVRITRAGYQWIWSGENVARGGPEFGVAAIFQAWLASSGHRANILHPAFVHLGVARTTGADGDVYWTQDFGSGGTC